MEGGWDGGKEGGMYVGLIDLFIGEWKNKRRDGWREVGRARGRV